MDERRCVVARGPPASERARHADCGGVSPRQSRRACVGRADRALRGGIGLGGRLGGRRGGHRERSADSVGTSQAGAAERGRCRRAHSGGGGFEGGGRGAGDDAGSHGSRGGPATPRGRTRECTHASLAGGRGACGSRRHRPPAAFRKRGESGARPSCVPAHDDRAVSGGAGADGGRAGLRSGRALLGGAPSPHVRRDSRALRRTS